MQNRMLGVQKTSFLYYVYKIGPITHLACNRHAYWSILSHPQIGRNLHNIIQLHDCVLIYIQHLTWPPLSDLLGKKPQKKEETDAGVNNEECKIEQEEYCGYVNVFNDSVVMTSVISTLYRDEQYFM